MTQTGTKPACVCVLLIEDEPTVLALVRAVLEGHGYAVVACESGAEALRLLEADNFHGVVSDMRTPCLLYTSSMSVRDLIQKHKGTIELDLHPSVAETGLHYA